ncbi:phosphatase PAP2 family protein [Arthrobacter sp. ZGTC412]|uniref:phosphatase PAP2 family protein n=1 Tax=Arthrobacter sp. ZGTC412 TaxID=2058900 RepID=UPI000CE35195|nr:phosphatase PAP2 family protein [Arthrobacter sp. ZGTC412]
MSTVRDRVDKWIKPYAVLGLTMIIGGALVLAMALLGAEVYSDVVDEEGLASLDIPALEYSQSLRNPAVSAFATGFTNVGGGIGMPILASVLTAWLTLLSRTWRPIVLVGGAALVSTTATTLGKGLVGRTRPDHSEAVPPFETSPSFPSGHTLNTTVVIGVLVYLMCLQFQMLWARITAITAGVIFIIAMGLSRVFLGHHWMTDVVAGWFLGLAWVGMVILAHRLFHLMRKREHAGPAPTFEHPVLREDHSAEPLPGSAGTSQDSDAGISEGRDGGAAQRNGGGSSGTSDGSTSRGSDGGSSRTGAGS